MTSLNATLHALARQGIAITREGPHIRLHSAGAIPAPLQRAVATYRADLLALADAQGAVAVAGGSTLASAPDPSSRQDARSVEPPDVATLPAPAVTPVELPSHAGQRVERPTWGIRSLADARAGRDLDALHCCYGDHKPNKQTWVKVAVRPNTWRYFCTICHDLDSPHHKSGAPSALDTLTLDGSGSTPAPTPDPMSSHQNAPHVAPQDAPHVEPSSVTAQRRAWAVGALDSAGLWLISDDMRGLSHIALDALGTLDSAGALLTLARQHGLTQLWIHPSWAVDVAGLPDRIVGPDGHRIMPSRNPGDADNCMAHPFVTEDAQGWDIQPHGLAIRLHAFTRGIAKSAIDLYLVGYGDVMSDAPDGKALALALDYFRRAVGIPLSGSTGTTSGHLLTQLHSGKPGAIALVAPAQLPPPALIASLESDTSWARPLTPDERQRRYVHGYDKRSMYLGACASLALGHGNATHVERPDPSSAPITFDKRTPGYWLAHVEGGDTANGLLPDPIRPTLRTSSAAAQMGAPDGYQWLTTPTLALAVEIGATLDIQEAWVWQTAHKPLEPWYVRLRDARLALLPGDAGDARRYPNSDARALALAQVKGLYRAQSGRFNAAFYADAVARGEQPSPLYRPDWRHALIAQARANQYRAARRLARVGVYPFAVQVDCFYIASDDPNPRTAIPFAPDTITLGDTLRDYSVKVAAKALTPDMISACDALTQPTRRASAYTRLLMALHSNDSNDSNDDTGALDASAASEGR